MSNNEVTLLVSKMSCWLNTAAWSNTARGELSVFRSTCRAKHKQLRGSDPEFDSRCVLLYIARTLAVDEKFKGWLKTVAPANLPARSEVSIV